MAHFKDATFEIISGGRSLPLYDDPDRTTEEDSGETQKYVEAVTGATFEVKVTLDQSFYWGDCDAVRVSIQFDGKKELLYRDIDRVEVFVTQTQHRSVHLSGMRRYDPESKQWTRGKYSFGALNVTETNDAQISPQQLKVLGKIRLWYQRIYYGKILSRGSEADYAANFAKFERVSSVSEKALKGQSIGNTIDAVDFVPSRPPGAKLPSKIPLPGPLGNEIVMNFLYRSRNTLQMIGCIPSTPQDSSSTPNATKPPKDATEEMKQLRARLAELENTHVKSERLPNAVKRERNDDDNTSQRKRRRQPGPVETVDLTSD